MSPNPTRQIAGGENQAHSSKGLGSGAGNPSLAASVPRNTQRGHSLQEGKVAIPRLRRESDAYATASTSTADKPRVAHACEPCRSRKTKCSGDRPSCKHCVKNGLKCFYSDGKRDRIKKQVGTLADRLNGLEELLRDLSLNANENDRERIQQALAHGTPFEDEDMETVRSQSQTSSRSTTLSRPGPYGEDYVSARIGSTDELDKVKEDFNRSSESQATGFHGKNSELAWIQRLKAHVMPNTDQRGETAGRPGAPTSPNFISDSTYLCDDLELTPLDQVDLLEVPPRHVADALFNDYLESIHTFFPIIGRKTFTEQYLGFFNEGRKPAANWRAILNMIFAISAKHAFHIKAPWKGQEHDHELYFARARGLGLDSESILAHPNIQRVQITGLMALYLLSIKQINRAWTLSGIASRHAISLGLNLRNDDSVLRESSKEIRYRVWWAICGVERLLKVMTGRLGAFSEVDCTVPTPLPLDEVDLFRETNPETFEMLRHWSKGGAELAPRQTAISASSSSLPPMRPSSTKSNSPATLLPFTEQKPDIPPSEALFFYYFTTLGLITSEVLRQLYYASAMEDSWSHTLVKIKNLNEKVKKWATGLPSLFDFTIAEQGDHIWVRQRVSLGFFYYSNIILANRPCLCRVDARIPNQSGEAKESSRSNAKACVDAAIQMLRLLPDAPDIIAVYTLSPWWCLVHHLMQAAAVLMLEMSCNAADMMPMRAEEIFSAAKKGWTWLREMGEDDIASYRAWRMYDEMLRTVAPKVGKHLSEPLPVEAMSNIDNEFSGGSLPFNFAQGIYEHSAVLPMPPHVYASYDQYLSHGLPTSRDQPDMFTAPEMYAMSFGGGETGVDFDAQSPSGEAG
ncbi:MAG: hypothetical protein Q9163_001799 [Psora crenata]